MVLEPLKFPSKRKTALLKYLFETSLAYRYYASNKLNEKSDVFSLGVVLLEIITSRPAITKNSKKVHIIKWVRGR